MRKKLWNFVENFWEVFDVTLRKIWENVKKTLKIKKVFGAGNVPEERDFRM